MTNPENVLPDDGTIGEDDAPVKINQFPDTTVLALYWIELTL